jgi:KUP system potassium uptake protein
MIGTLSLAIGFGSSHALAAGYGIAVSTTMVATTILLSIAVREIWAVPLPLAVGMGIAFGVIDVAFLSANMMKLFDGGWVPLLLGSIVYLAILVWQRGNAAVQEQIDEMEIPIEDIVAQILRGDVRRVPGTAVFVARIARDIPPIVVWHLRHIRSLHETIVIINAVTALVPYVAAKDRLEVREIAPQVWRAHARFGFMEQPDLPALLEILRVKGCPVDPANATYFIGHETIVSREDGKGLPLLVRNAFAFLKRNSAEAAEYFRLPRDMVVEIGRQFAI